MVALFGRDQTTSWCWRIPLGLGRRPVKGGKILDLGDRMPPTSADRARRFRINHPGYMRQWFQNHPEKVREYRERRRLIHPNYLREWHALHPEKREEYRLRAKMGAGATPAASLEPLCSPAGQWLAERTRPDLRNEGR